MSLSRTRFDEFTASAVLYRQLAGDVDSSRLRNLYLDVARVHDDLTVLVAAGRWLDWTNPLHTQAQTRAPIR